MRNNMLLFRNGIVRGSMVVGLVLALFAMVSFTAFAHDQSSQGFRTHAGASLQNEPSGKADLNWNSQTKDLTVTVHVSGLQPGSSHADHIHAGTCAKEGPILYSLNDIVVDSAGNGTSQTTINNVNGGVPASGWAVMVHSGAAAESTPILCGDVVNPTGATSVSVPLSVAPVTLQK